MSSADWLGLIMLAALVFYALLGGADFGGGVWDLLATGPRAREQRQLIEHALAPVWEANHVWLIFVVTVLFTAFPRAFSAAMTALHVPLTLLLLGIVLRGSAFVFRQYGGGDDRVQERWGRVFAIASTVSPLFLGAALAALCSGDIRVSGGTPTTGFFAGWVGVFPAAVGLLTLAAFAFLAATYLCVEARAPELRRDFTRRAYAAQAALLVTATLAALSIGQRAAAFRERLLHSGFSLPVMAGAAAAGAGALLALRSGRLTWARALAAAEVALILGGWGLAQRPYLIAPDVTLQNSAAPAVTLRLLLPTVALGALLLFPSLYWLMRIFKRVT